MSQPSKYSTLVSLRENGLPIPDMLFLSNAELHAVTYRDRVTDFIQTTGANTYIIRSAVTAEDSHQQSYAGYFKSSDRVASAAVLDTIPVVFEENTRRAKKVSGDANVGLLIMPFITAERGGVTITPWHFYHRHSLVTSAQTPQQAVAGEATTTELLEHLTDTDQTTWQQRLGTLLSTITALYKEPVNLEWVDTGSKLYILQARPVPVIPTALFTDTKTTLPTDWTVTAYAQSFGKLSPLTASLFKRLFVQNTVLQNILSIKATPYFLHQLPSGQLCENHLQKQLFFSNQDWLSAAKRTYQHTTQSLSPPTLQRPTEFNFKRCQEAFGFWQAAAFYEQQKTGFALPQEYELSRVIETADYPTKTLTEQWKLQFLNETLPLREKISADPTLVWSSFSAQGEIEWSENWERCYQATIEQSLHSYAMEEQEQAEYISQDMHGEVVYIAHPASYAQALPAQKIIVTPYIPQAWITALGSSSGFIVQHLAPLSHVDLYIRENNIPIAVLSEKKFQRLAQEHTITSLFN